MNIQKEPQTIVDLSPKERKIDVVAWLKDAGYHPDRDLLHAVKYLGSVSKTAMFEAAGAGELSVCEWLFENGASSTISTLSSIGWTPLFEACCHGHLHVAKWLYKVGADKDVRVRDEIGCSPMMVACEKGHLEVAQWLFTVGAACDISKRSHNGATPMHRACQHGHLHVAKWLAAVGASSDVTSKDKFNVTPMHRAAQHGLLHVVAWLYENGAAQDVGARTEHGLTPMHLACEKGWYPRVAVWLLVHGATNNPDTKHVDERLLRMSMRGVLNHPHHRPEAQRALAQHLADHSNFTRLVFPAVYARKGGSSPMRLRDLVRRAQRPQSLYYEPPPPPCALSRLRGHELSVMVMIADFAGVYRGRTLRNLREASAIIAALGGP